MIDYAALSTPVGAAALAATLRRDSFAVVRFAPAARPLLQSLAACSAALFALEADTKNERLGALRSTREGQLTGYRNEPGSREFVEMRLCLDASRRPYPNPFPAQPTMATASSAEDDGDACTADGRSTTFARTLRQCFDLFGDLGLLALDAIACDLGVHPRCFRSLLDRPQRYFDASLAAEQSNSAAAADGASQEEPPPLLTNAVLRICRYEVECEEEARDTGAVDRGDGGAAATAEDERTESGAPVVFGEHTDSSFLTIAPCSAVPGLELLVASPRPSSPSLDDAAEGRRRVWRMPESEPACASCDGCACIVMVGEFIHVLTRRVYPAAIHRVLRPRSTVRSACGEPRRARISFPFLIRGRPAAVISTTKYNMAAMLSTAKMRLHHTKGAEAAAAAAGDVPPASSGIDDGTSKARSPSMCVDAEAIIAAAEAGEGPLLHLKRLKLGELHSFMSARRARQTHDRSREGMQLLVGEAPARRRAEVTAESEIS